MKIHKGDTIKIISGNDAGKQGKVLVAFPEKGTIVVEGINMKKKHVKPRQQGQKGELVRMPAPFPVSRAMVVCPQCKKITRMGSAMHDSGTKSRICKKCNGSL